MSRPRAKSERTRWVRGWLAGKVAGVFAAGGLLYWLTRSRWLDDWDSVQFALGVTDFNLFQHQPHPPGYPLYILSGWLGGLMGSSPQSALVSVSCLSGGLFLAAWFYVAARRVGESTAWVATGMLAAAPIVWMTATKVLTDMPASAFMAVQLGLVFRYLDHRQRGWLVGAAIAGAIGVGLRPQNVLAVGLMLLGGVAVAGGRKRDAWMAGAVLGAGCLAWLVPTMWLQAGTPQADGDWLAYPARVLEQWKWRLDKPTVFVGAGNWSWDYLLRRTYRHTLKAWYVLGMGWGADQGMLGWSCAGLYGLGLWRYVGRFREQGSRHRALWRHALWWAPVYVLTIFICLPPSPRYYLPIAPLWVLPAASGLLELPGRWRMLAGLLPALMWVTGVGLALEGHTTPPPPVRLVERVKHLHEPEQWGKVALLLSQSRRHADYYAPEFYLNSPGAGRPKQERLEEAVAIYTDDAQFLEKTGWQGMELKEVARFERSRLIHSKHPEVSLWQVRPADSARARHPINGADRAGDGRHRPGTGRD